MFWCSVNKSAVLSHGKRNKVDNIPEFISNEMALQVERPKSDNLTMTLHSWVPILTEHPTISKDKILWLEVMMKCKVLWKREGRKMCLVGMAV